jgi:hypothetical protein
LLVAVVAVRAPLTSELLVVVVLVVLRQIQSILFRRALCRLRSGLGGLAETVPMAFLERPQCLTGFLFLVAVAVLIVLEILTDLRVLLAVEVATLVLVDLGECLEMLAGQVYLEAIVLTGLVVAVVVLALLAQMLRPQSVVLAVQGEHRLSQAHHFSTLVAAGVG